MSQYKRFPLEGAGEGGQINLTAERAVGSITEGMVFTNATLQEFAEALLLQEKFPNLTAPSSTFTSSVTGLHEVGSVVNINFSSSFNRGSISPSYGTSGFRSGLANEHILNGTGLISEATTDATVNQSVTNYTVTLGTQSWTGRVAYDEGEQPLSSYGNPFNAPLPAGQTAVVTRSINGVYPFFVSIPLGTDSKQALQAHGTMIEIDFPAEDGTNKQQILMPQVWGSISQVTQFNTLSGAWDNITNLFTNVIAVDVDVNGNMIPYNRFINTSATIGARKLRFYW